MAVVNDRFAAGRFFCPANATNRSPIFKNYLFFFHLKNPTGNTCRQKSGEQKKSHQRDTRTNFFLCARRLFAACSSYGGYNTQTISVVSGSEGSTGIFPNTNNIGQIRVRPCLPSTKRCVFYVSEGVTICYRPIRVNIRTHARTHTRTHGLRFGEKTKRHRRRRRRRRPCRRFAVLGGRLRAYRSPREARAHGRPAKPKGRETTTTRPTLLGIGKTTGPTDGIPHVSRTSVRANRSVGPTRPLPVRLADVSPFSRWPRPNNNDGPGDTAGPGTGLLSVRPFSVSFTQYSSATML